MYPAHSSSGKWVVALVLIGNVIGGLLGMNLKEAKWLHPAIGQAEAQQIQVDNQHQAVMNSIDEEVYRSQADLQIKQNMEETRRLELETQYRERSLSIQMENQQRRGEIINSILMALGVALAIGLAGILFAAVFMLIRYAWAHWQAAPPQKQQDPWSSPVYRKRQREKARKRERLARQVREIGNEMQLSSSNPATDQDELPLAQ